MMTTNDRGNFDQLWQDQQYVERYNRFYPFPPEQCEEYAQLLELNKQDILIDFGCGQGDFLNFVAPRINSGYGVDSSLHQFSSSQQKIRFNLIPYDFLNWEKGLLQQDIVFTKAFARASLHHLTYDDKKVFFAHLKRYFAPGSLFLLHDMIFDFSKKEIFNGERKKRLVAEAEKHYGEMWKYKERDIVATWYDEFPEDLTTWKELFAEAGFYLKERKLINSFISMLIMEKK